MRQGYMKEDKAETHRKGRGTPAVRFKARAKLLTSRDAGWERLTGCREQSPEGAVEYFGARRTLVGVSGEFPWN
jgi:hypothetical protein